jgi:hypothetical protein
MSKSMTTIGFLVDNEDVIPTLVGWMFVKTAVKEDSELSLFRCDL